MGSICSTQIRMHHNKKFFFSSVRYSVIAHYYLENGQLIALVYQYEDNQVKCYMLHALDLQKKAYFTHTRS